MELTIYHIDAFTNKVFGGNYAAVIILEDWLEPELMQAIATENNLSETAFICLEASGDWAIRWFSPLTEIDFCGHATLASAFVIFQLYPHLVAVDFSADAIGRIRVNRGEQGDFIMDFPNRKPQLVTDIPPALSAALSIQPVDVLKNTQAYFAVFSNSTHVTEIEIDLAEVKKLAPLDLVITAAGHETDFISRYFWPANGGDEDPVTGSIHAGLAPYWAEKLDKTTLTAYQASTRGGYLHCEVHRDRVWVRGQAVQYMQGTIYV